MNSKIKFEWKSRITVNIRQRVDNRNAWTIVDEKTHYMGIFLVHFNGDLLKLSVKLSVFVTVLSYFSN